MDAAIFQSIETKKWDPVFLALWRDNNLAAVRSKRDGELPLHNIFRHNGSFPSVRLLESLLEAFPDAVRERTSDGDLPLHLALYSYSSIKIIRLLITAYPESAAERNKYGNLPLHCALRNNLNIEIITIILDSYPQGAYERDEANWLPLHIVLKADAPRENVISILLERCPDLAKEKDFGGELPLHYSLRKSSISLDTVRVIFNAFPDAVHETNPNVLHLAFARQVPFDFLKMLIKMLDGDSIDNEESEDDISIM